MRYCLKEAHNEHPIGTEVYKFHGQDFGLAHDDTALTGVYHINVTLNKDGNYPFFTIPESKVSEMMEIKQDSSNVWPTIKDVIVRNNTMMNPDFNFGFTESIVNTDSSDVLDWQKFDKFVKGFEREKPNFVHLIDELVLSWSNDSRGEHICQRRIKARRALEEAIEAITK